MDADQGQKSPEAAKSLQENRRGALLFPLYVSA
jgi:hypothetical protein